MNARFVVKRAKPIADEIVIGSYRRGVEASSQSASATSAEASTNATLRPRL